jgi:hypothetical protein
LYDFMYIWEDILDESFDFWSIYQNWAVCSIRVNHKFGISTGVSIILFFINFVSFFYYKLLFVISWFIIHSVVWIYECICEKYLFQF